MPKFPHAVYRTEISHAAQKFRVLRNVRIKTPTHLVIRNLLIYRMVTSYIDNVGPLRHQLGSKCRLYNICNAPFTHFQYLYTQTYKQMYTSIKDRLQYVRCPGYAASFFWNILHSSINSNIELDYKLVTVNIYYKNKSYYGQQ